jgi:glycosyltransferase involved in cell wall biosynthesis
MYISLHRSEGFGLNLAEALALGLPVLATGWGLSDSITGHPNFIGVRWTLVIDPQHIYDQVPGAGWAEADVEFAAAEQRKRVPSTSSTCKNGQLLDAATRVQWPRR